MTGVVVASGLLLGGLLFGLAAKATAAEMTAEIVAQIDGVIVTERDVARRSALLQKRLANLLPALRLDKQNRQALTLDLLLQKILQQRHLIKERALPVAENAVKKRLSLLTTRASGKTERSFWEAFARHELVWEGYVGRVAEFNAPVTPEDTLDERTRLRANAYEPRYRLEEIFLPRLEAGKNTRDFANTLYRSLQSQASRSSRSSRRGGVFAKVARILPAPYAHEGLATQLLYKSDLPPAVLDALARRKGRASGILPPVTSPYGVHLYRVTRHVDKKTTTRYSFVQTFFLQSGFGAEQVSILANPSFCTAPREASLSLGYYDLQTFDDIPEADLNSELKQGLATLSIGETAGPFPFAQSLIVMITLCDKQQAADRGDSFEELTRNLRLIRARALALSLVENLRTQASIEKQADEALSAPRPLVLPAP